jgi:hypothetical protein
MNSKTLIYSIIGIFIIATGAYFIFSPIATRTLDAPLAQEVQPSESPEEVSVPVTKEVTNSEIKTATSTKNSPTPSVPVIVPPKNTPVDIPGYTAGEVALHASENSCWSIISGEVYDLTTYISKHPGGDRNILRICGKDGTSAFEGEHGGESRPEKILAGYKIGPLK